MKTGITAHTRNYKDVYFEVKRLLSLKRDVELHIKPGMGRAEIHELLFTNFRIAWAMYANLNVFTEDEVTKTHVDWCKDYALCDVLTLPE